MEEPYHGRLGKTLGLVERIKLAASFGFKGRTMPQMLMISSCSEGNLRHHLSALHEIEVACGESQLDAGAACHALIHHRAREGVFSQKSLKIRALSKKA